MHKIVVRILPFSINRKYAQTPLNSVFKTLRVHCDLRIRFHSWVLDFPQTSLARVHAARDNKDRRKLAIKVQHRGLGDTLKGELIALEGIVKTIDCLFWNFRIVWVMDEIIPNLPKELNFCNEGNTAETAACNLKRACLDCVIQKIHQKQNNLYGF